MRRTMRWFAVVVLLAIVLGIWLAACITRPPKPKYPYWVRPTARQDAARLDRRIGILAQSGDPCPKAKGWNERPLFLGAGGRPPSSPSALKAGLDRFCVYELAASGGKPEFPPSVAKKFLRFSADTVALASSADELEPVTSQEFERRFLTEAGVLSSSPSPIPPVESKNRVRLVFLDSQPTGDDLPRPTCTREGVESAVRSKHGYSLGQMAARLACPPGSGSCGISIASRLVLPITDFDPTTHTVVSEDTACGGVAGTLGALAEAIHQAVDAWKANPGDTKHLVLNLSAAWDGQLMNSWREKFSELPADDQAVWAALEYAASQDVLVIAAAGNRTLGPDPTEAPLLPAGWQGMSFPDRPGEVADGPLVYAVSGVDATGWPLANARASLGEAPLVAYADHAVVRAFEGILAGGTLSASERTAVLTGSSVSTAVVSTTAAMLWGQNPDLSRSQLMKMLYDAGRDLCRPPKFGAEGTGWSEVHQVRFDEVVAAPGASRPLAARSCSGPLRVPWAPLDLAGFTSTERSLFRPLLQDAGTMPPDDPARRCHAHRIYLAAGTEPTPLCPGYIYPGLERDAWTHPQPGEDPCPSCAMGGVPPPRSMFAGTAAPLLQARSRESGVSTTAIAVPPGEAYTVFVAIDSNWGSYISARALKVQGGCVEGATLEIEGIPDGEDSPIRVAYVVGESLCPGQPVTLKVAKQDNLRTILSAALIHTVGTGTNKFSVLTPLYLGTPDGKADTSESAAASQVAQKP